MDSLIPIGRFSRITRLSIRALRRYDEMGVLQPAWVDPSSGYRYYRLGQARDAEAVRILRGLDMPIAQIREVLAAGDPDLVRSTWPCIGSTWRSGLSSIRGGWPSWSA